LKQEAPWGFIPNPSDEREEIHMKNSMLVILSVLCLALGASAFAGNGPQWYGSLDTCPDYDGDGICNGDDPDYVPGDECPSNDADYLFLSNPDAPNADDPLHAYGWFGGLDECKDDDNDGICNGQDPDYEGPTE